MDTRPLNTGRQCEAHPATFVLHTERRCSVGVPCSLEKELHVARQVTADSDGYTVCDFCGPIENAESRSCRYCGRGFTGSASEIACSSFDCFAVQPIVPKGMVQLVLGQSQCYPSNKSSLIQRLIDADVPNHTTHVKGHRRIEPNDQAETNYE